jgi:glutathione S-transferase
MHRLYYAPGACSMAPHIVLEEIGQPYEIEHVSSKAGEQTQTPQWLAQNPKGRVPALSGVPGRIGGAADLLTEAHAILVYLARSYPEARLLPADAAGEARAIEWMNWLSGAVHGQSYGQIWRPHRFVADRALFDAVTAQGERNVTEQYGYIESLLADGRDWAVPGGYSVVDPYLLVFYRWGQVIGRDMRATYPAWTKLTERTIARPAVRRVLAKEGIEIQ